MLNGICSEWILIVLLIGCVEKWVLRLGGMLKCVVEKCVEYVLWQCVASGCSGEYLKGVEVNCVEYVLWMRVREYCE